MLVSRTLALRYWSIETAVGKALVVDDPGGGRPARIVGVVGDVKHYGLDAEVTPDVYMPIAQVHDQTSQWLANNMYWGVRTIVDPEAVRAQVRAALRDVDADVPAAEMRPMEEALEAAVAPRRLNLWLVRAFAALALLLAAAGVYAVTSFSVALRRREMAIRAALGATEARNLRNIVGGAMRPIAIGLAAGVLAAAAAGPALRAVLFGVEPFAPAPFSLVTLTLLLVGASAALIAALPVRHADAVEALKGE